MKQEDTHLSEMLNIFPKDIILKTFLQEEPMYYGDVLKKTSISPMLGMRHITELKMAGILQKVKGNAKLMLNTDYIDLVKSMVH